MADVVEVADDRHVDVHFAQLVLDVRHGGRGLIAVDGDADDFRAGARQRRHLLGCPVGVRRVGVGHRLHHDGCAAADRDFADFDGNGFVPLGGAGKFHHIISPLGRAPGAGPKQEAKARCLDICRYSVPTSD